MIARNHHYISKCYLKGFTKNPKKPQLYVIDTRNPEPFTTSTDNVGVKRDFNRIEIEGLAPDALENALAGFEGELAPALRRIEDARSLDSLEDKTLLLNLLGMIHIKNPQRRDTFRNLEESVTRRIMDIATSKKEIFDSQIRQAKASGYISEDADVDYETIKRFIDEDEFKIEVPNERLLLREMDLLDSVLSSLFERQWHLVKAPEDGTGFVTSDHPAILQWQDPKLRNGIYPPGLGLKNTEILFPICNSLAMIGTFEEEEMEVDATPEFIAKFNGTIISRSKNQVYARDDTFLYMLEDGKIQEGKTLVNYVKAALGGIK